MGRKKLWFGKTRLMKVRLGEETFHRYKAYLIANKKTIQDDIGDYVIQKIK